MLVLSRRAGESILIGGEIQVIILRTTSRAVHLGIRAPRDMRILRTELEPLEAPEEGPRQGAASGQLEEESTAPPRG